MLHLHFTICIQSVFNDFKSHVSADLHIRLDVTNLSIWLLFIILVLVKRALKTRDFFMSKFHDLI